MGNRLLSVVLNIILVVELVKLAKDNIKSSKPLQFLRSPQYYNHAHFLGQKTVFGEATFLKKLFGTNPNRPHMFRRAWGMCHFGSQFSYLNQAFKIQFLPISHALQLIK